MVRVEMIATAGALLIGLAKARLASAINPTTHMRALVTSTSDADCATERETCLRDDTCMACATAWETSNEACTQSVTTTDGDICPELEDFVCCATDGCEDSTAFGALIGA